MNNPENALTTSTGSLDIHAHTIPAPFIEALSTEVPKAAPRLTKRSDGWYLSYPSGRVSGPVPEGMFDVEARLEHMERSRIGVQALSVPPTHFCYDLSPEEGATAARLHNDAMLAMAAAYADRFVVLGHLPLQHPTLSIAELERLAAMPAVVGVELATNVDGLALDDPSLAPIWSALDRHGLAVVLHPHTVAGAARMQQYYLHNFVGNPMDSTLAAGSLMFGGVLSRNPNLRIALLHGGGFLPYQIGRFDHGWRVRAEAREQLDVPPSHLLGRFWFDTLTHDHASLRFLCDRVGPGRLCLGSDYPFDMADDDAVATIDAAFADRDLITAITRTTPRDLLTRSIASA